MPSTALHCTAPAFHLNSLFPLLSWTCQFVDELIFILSIECMFWSIRALLISSLSAISALVDMTGDIFQRILEISIYIIQPLIICKLPSWPFRHLHTHNIVFSSRVTKVNQETSALHCTASHSGDQFMILVKTNTLWKRQILVLTRNNWPLRSCLQFLRTNNRLIDWVSECY